MFYLENIERTEMWNEFFLKEDIQFFEDLRIFRRFVAGL